MSAVTAALYPSVIDGVLTLIGAGVGLVGASRRGLGVGSAPKNFLKPRDLTISSEVPRS